MAGEEGNILELPAIAVIGAELVGIGFDDGAHEFAHIEVAVDQGIGEAFQQGWMGSLESPVAGRGILGIEASWIQLIDWIDQAHVEQFFPETIGKVAGEHAVFDQAIREQATPVAGCRLHRLHTPNGRGSALRSDLDAIRTIAVGRDHIVGTGGSIVDFGRIGVHRVHTTSIGVADAGEVGRHLEGLQPGGLLAPKAEGIQMAATVMAEQTVVVSHTHESRGATSEEGVVGIFDRAAGCAPAILPGGGG